ncbi:MAG: lysophospholipid acyltransferase family protein [Rhodobiaceae bacterium]|nr:lysophospholipid acyltransferase family protein [Rhodobiaceae bacterium]
MLKKIGRSRAVQMLIGSAIAYYLRLVHVTGRYVIDPPTLYEDAQADLPVIIAMWHGEHFMMPFVRRGNYVVDALISRHRDGEINAIAAHKLGINTIRGSGAHNTEFRRKGGVPAFREMLASLKAGRVVALTADVPKVSKVAGAGIVRLAAHSGRAIMPVAIATSRRRRLDTWDKSVINLPFSRIVISGGPLIRVARDADDAELEAKRKTVEDGLNSITARAYALADAKQ